jgi:hypothetical protein
MGAGSAALLLALTLLPPAPASSAKERRNAIECEVCNFVVEELDQSVRNALPDAKTIEVGFRLLPDGTRRVDTMPEPQTELFFQDLIADVCSGGSNATPWRDEPDPQVKEVYKSLCTTFVGEHEEELVGIKDWERVSVMQRT